MPKPDGGVSSPGTVAPRLARRVKALRRLFSRSWHLFGIFGEQRARVRLGVRLAARIYDHAGQDRHDRHDADNGADDGYAERDVKLTLSHVFSRNEAFIARIYDKGTSSTIESANA